MAVAVSSEQQADSFVRSTHKLLIDGEWVEAASGKTFPTINPATEEPLADIGYGEAEDIDAAVRAARRAFEAVRDRPRRGRGAGGRPVPVHGWVADEDRGHDRADLGAPGAG